MNETNVIMAKQDIWHKSINLLNLTQKEKMRSDVPAEWPQETVLLFYVFAIGG